MKPHLEHARTGETEGEEGRALGRGFLDFSGVEKTMRVCSVFIGRVGVGSFVISHS